jgi:HEPN domain-containing protein
MPHDPALIGEVRAWLSKAAKDLAAAEYELKAEPPFADDIVFHAQQAVEKTLKAYLSYNQVPFRKTHNLVELGHACAQIDQRLEPLLRRAAPLSEYAWKFRYPGDPHEATSEEAADALVAAQEVFETILDRLPPEARP